MNLLKNITLKSTILVMVAFLLFSFKWNERKDAAKGGPNLEFTINSETFEIAPHDLQKSTWDEAILNAQNMVVGGHADWRLPTDVELKMIFKTAFRKGSNGSRFIYHRANKFKDINAFYWSSDLSQWFAEDPIVRSFYNGKKNTLSKESVAHVRCVRLKKD